MPQSDITNKGEILPQEVLEVLKWYKRAESFGMECEWLEWYTCGIRQGMAPLEAAANAALEWDLI